MSDSKDGGKRQVSFYIEGDLITRLDDWLAIQKTERGYETDRSHVINILLRRFLETNHPKKPDTEGEPR